MNLCLWHLLSQKSLYSLNTTLLPFFFSVSSLGHWSLAGSYAFSQSPPKHVQFLTKFKHWTFYYRWDPSIVTDNVWEHYTRGPGLRSPSKLYLVHSRILFPWVPAPRCSSGQGHRPFLAYADALHAVWGWLPCEHNRHHHVPLMTNLPKWLTLTTFNHLC